MAWSGKRSYYIRLFDRHYNDAQRKIVIFTFRHTHINWCIKYLPITIKVSTLATSWIPCSFHSPHFSLVFLWGASSPPSYISFQTYVGHILGTRYELAPAALQGQQIITLGVSPLYSFSSFLFGCWKKERRTEKANKGVSHLDPLSRWEQSFSWVCPGLAAIY